VFRRRPVAVIALAVLSISFVAFWWFSRPNQLISGQVVNLAGQPLAGASVRYSAGETTTTDAAGNYEITSNARGGWVTVAADGYLSRTRAAQSGDPTLVRLFPDDGAVVRLLFAGDVMFGRRFYDENDDGDPADGLLGPAATVTDHVRLLEGVAPLLADSDLTIINLESPLIEEPWSPANAPRASRWHPTKEFVFASSPEAAGALREVGVDVIGLGNNHLFDALDPGVASTKDALMAAGFAPTDLFGAGTNIDDAWRPAIREIRGQTLAFVACTTITGVEHSITYVASATKGGAAECSDDKLREVVTAARAAADLVVVMIHGGFEYTREPSEAVIHLSQVATDAGAKLVINQHPHVSGGFASGAETLTAWSMGNLLFDQTVQPTFASYVLRVDVRAGAVVDAYIEPIMIRAYLPVGVVGDAASWVALSAQSLSDGAWAVDDGSLTLAPGSVSARTIDVPPVANGGTAPPVLDLDGACVRDLPGTVLVGRDEVWTGDFEDGTADQASTPGELWNLVTPSPDRRVTPDAAASGAFGVRLERTGSNRQDVVLSPLHRLLVQPGDPITVLLTVRATGVANASLQLSWYNDTKGPSQAQSVVSLPATSSWQTMRLDMTVPDHSVAVAPTIRLAPPLGNRGSIDVDDVRTIVWHRPTAAPACQYVRFTDSSAIDALVATVASLPGGTPAPAPGWIAGLTLLADPVPALPAGPVDSGWGPSE
jgi:poly-gamma-glutamate synthesis protein (capsule biosynthesis protein)